METSCCILEGIHWLDNIFYDPIKLASDESHVPDRLKSFHDSLLCPDADAGKNTAAVSMRFPKHDAVRLPPSLRIGSPLNL